MIPIVCLEENGEHLLLFGGQTLVYARYESAGRHVLILADTVLVRRRRDFPKPSNAMYRYSICKFSVHHLHIHREVGVVLALGSIGADLVVGEEVVLRGFSSGIERCLCCSFALSPSLAMADLTRVISDSCRV